jgi:diguanylate cyclase (GGDEF)-like protein
MTDYEQCRLEAVYATGLLDSPAEGRFDRITRIARRLFGVPIATITLVDGDRQWFKSALGIIGKTEDPREVSFCSRAIESDEILVVEDASADPRFRNNPLVTGKPFIRFYAGKPVTYEGLRVGTLCVIDTKPRKLDGALAQDLEDLALWVESEFDSDRLSDAQTELMSEVDRLREMAMVDPLTRTWNRNGLNEVFTRELSLAERQSEPLGVIMADIDHFKSVNDTYGHDAGDAVLKRVADRIRLSVRPYDSIGRMGGEEFLIVLPKSYGPTVSTVAERVRKAVSATPIELPDNAPLKVTISLGVASTRCRPGFSPSLEQLAKAADQALYQAKEGGRNQVANAPELKPRAI